MVLYVAFMNLRFFKLELNHHTCLKISPAGDTYHASQWSRPVFYLWRSNFSSNEQYKKYSVIINMSLFMDKLNIGCVKFYRHILNKWYTYMQDFARCVVKYSYICNSLVCLYENTHTWLIILHSLVSTLVSVDPSTCIQYPLPLTWSLFVLSRVA